MRFCSLLVSLAGVVVVSGLPQQTTSNKQTAPALPIEAFNTGIKILSPEELKAQFGSNAGDSAPSFRLDAISTAAAPTCSQPRTRWEWEQMSISGQRAFLNAVTCLMNKPTVAKFRGAKTRWDDFAGLHQQMVNTVHNNAIFLVWHRYFLWSFESILATECGYTGTLPWFDETKYPGNLKRSSVFRSGNFGTLTSNGRCVTDAGFPAITLNMGPQSSTTPHCLSRNYNADVESYITKANYQTCSSTSFSKYASCIEQGVHGYGHVAIGGVMNDFYASPSDPVFFLHHAWVDRLYYNWQAGDQVRVSTTGVNGADSTGATLTMNTQIDVRNFRPTIPLRNVLNTQSTTLCYKYSY